MFLQTCSLKNLNPCEDELFFSFSSSTFKLLNVWIIYANEIIQNNNVTKQALQKI